MEEAVTNTTVLIFLSKVKRLNLLDIYNVFTTPEIIKEVITGKNILDDEKNSLQEYINKKIKIETPEKIILSRGIGESSAISLCMEKKIKTFFSDDKQARKSARLFALEVKGTLGLIIKNLELRKITKDEAREILNLLVSNSYYITTQIYLKTLELIDNI